MVRIAPTKLEGATTVVRTIWLAGQKHWWTRRDRTITTSATQVSSYSSAKSFKVSKLFKVLNDQRRRQDLIFSDLGGGKRGTFLQKNEEFFSSKEKSIRVMYGQKRVFSLVYLWKHFQYWIFIHLEFAHRVSHFIWFFNEKGS